MMKLRLLLSFLAFCSVFTINAQRYLTPQFTAVTKTTAIYGQNFTVLTTSVTGHTARQPLVCDIYQAVGDAGTGRPVMILYQQAIFCLNLFADHLRATVQTLSLLKCVLVLQN